MTLSPAQRIMLGELRWRTCTYDARGIAARVGTTASGASRTLRSLEDRHLARCNLTNQWSITSAGEALYDGLDA